MFLFINLYLNYLLNFIYYYFIIYLLYIKIHLIFFCFSNITYNSLDNKIKMNI